MFITYIEETGLVKGYSDGPRNSMDIQEGEVQVEVDMSFDYIACAKDALVFRDDKLFNGEIELASLT
jgi:hypothetical protein